VIEADGLKWPDNPTAREDDAERQALLEADGERVVRVTWHGNRELRQTVERLRRAGAPKLHGS
jgi:very-short-patch-repair endonuclease